MKRSKIEERKRFASELALADRERGVKRMEQIDTRVGEIEERRRFYWGDKEPPRVVVCLTDRERELEYRRWRDRHHPVRAQIPGL